MSELSYFHTWKGAENLTSRKFINDWERLFGGNSASVRDLVSLLFRAALLFVVKGNSGYPFKNSQLRNEARDYLLRRIPQISSMLGTADQAFTAKDVVFLIKSYNILRVSPPSSIRDRLIAESQARFSEMPIKDFRYILHNFVKINVYPGDPWIQKWSEVLNQIATDRPDEISREDLLDTLYYMSIMDYMRTAIGQTDSESPCRKVVMEFLEAFQCAEMEGKRVDAAIYYSACYYKLDFVQRALFDRDQNHDASDGGFFYQELNSRGKDVSLIKLADGYLTKSFQNSSGITVISRIDRFGSHITDLDRGALCYDPAAQFMAAVHHGNHAEKIILSIPFSFLLHTAKLTAEAVFDTLLSGVDHVGPGHYVLHPDGLRPAQDAGAWEFPIPSLMQP